jgi:tetratricopeptide (TPR) repeat protein
MNGSQGQQDSRNAASTRLANLRHFLAFDPGNARLRRDVVNTAVAAGEFEYVRELAESRLADVPGDVEAQFDRATALVGLKEFAAAFELLQLLDTTIPGVRFNSGFCLFMLGRYADARPYFEAGVQAGERSTQLLRFLLLSLHQLGDFDAARELIESNEPLFSNSHELAGNAALLYHDALDQVSAKQWADRALARDPDNVDALIVDGTISAERLDAAGAQASFQRALRRAPDNGRAWVGLGSITMLSHDFSTAAEQMQRGLTTMPKHVGSWQALGWNHIFAGKLDDAEDVFKHAIELNRNFAESHGGLASVAAMRGDRANAEHLIELAERLDKDCQSTKFARAVLAGQKGGPEMFRKELARAIRTLPGDASRLAALIRSSD